MVDELNTAIAQYQSKWQALVANRKDTAFFESLRPTSVAWKTIDLADFEKRYEELRDLSDQIHSGWVNERWLATFHLKEATLPLGITGIKLMQRRPASSDATGLDHLDFYFKPDTGQSGKTVLRQEPELEWTEEKNGEHCKWLSLWFADTEAKLRTDTVLDVCAQELKDVERQILEGES